MRHQRLSDKDFCSVILSNGAPEGRNAFEICNTLTLTQNVCCTLQRCTPSSSSWKLFRPRRLRFPIQITVEKKWRVWEGCQGKEGGFYLKHQQCMDIWISLPKGDRRERHSKSSRNSVLFLSSFDSELYDLETKRLFSFCGQAIAFLPPGPGEAPGPGFPPLWIRLSSQPGLPESFWNQLGLPAFF